MAKRLTQKSVENARHDASKRVELPDSNGLYLVLQPSGAKSWAFRYRRPTDGKPAKLTLGAVRTLREGEDEPAGAPVMGEPLTLAQARWLSGQVRHGVAVKEDPAAERRATKTQDRAAGDRDHFDVVAQRFLERYARPNTRASTFGETVNVLGFVSTKDGKTESRGKNPTRKHTRPLETWPAMRWKGRKIQSITRRDINEMLDAIVDADAPNAANSTLAAVRKLFNWCVDQDLLPASPCVSVKKRVATKERDRALSDDELRLVWLAAGRMAWPFGHLVKLLTLTGARRDEWAAATWSEVDMKGAVFHLPKERAKNRLAHNIALAPPAEAVLKDLAKHALAGKPDWLFSTGTGRAKAPEGAPLAPISGFSKAKDRLDATIVAILAEEEAERAAKEGRQPAEVQPIPDWRLHDLRRTVATGMARLGVQLPVIERVLNHVSGSFAGVVRIYQRHEYADEMRNALERWGEAVERISRGEPAIPSNVIPLRA